MAYAFRFPPDVTDLIYSMHSWQKWRWEMVREVGKAPSALCFNTPADGPAYPGGRLRMPEAYLLPFLLPVNMPFYTVESCSEHIDFGKIVQVQEHSIVPFHNIPPEQCEVRLIDHEGQTPPWMISFRLRLGDGEAPSMFRRLQKENDERIWKMWFECEPACACVVASVGDSRFI